MNGNKLSDYAFAVMQAALLQEKLPGASLPLVSLVAEALAVPERPEAYAIQFLKTGMCVAIPVTGGLDSTVLYMRNHSRKNLRAYYVQFGQSYAMKEKNALDYLDISYTCLRSDSALPLEKSWKHIIPARNFYILSLIAEQMWGGGDILFGVVDGERPERGGDKSVRFLGSLEAMLLRLTFPVYVAFPLASETKTDLVKSWLDEKWPLDMLAKTVSCFSEVSGDYTHCGACQACLRKYLAFISNGLELETEKDVRIDCKDYIEKYKRLMNKALQEEDFSRYSKRRCEQDLAAITML